jgi:hypothetical protein
MIHGQRPDRYGIIFGIFSSVDDDHLLTDALPPRELGPEIVEQNRKDCH